MTMGGPQIADAVAQTRHFRLRGINFSGSNCVTAFMLKLSIESLKEIKNQVEGGFKPLPCRVQVYDYGRKLRFKSSTISVSSTVRTTDSKNAMRGGRGCGLSAPCFA